MNQDSQIFCKPVIHCLSAEDSARLRKLNEEIASRATEMALIVSRTLGKKAALPVVSFTQSASNSGQSASSPVATHDMTFVDGRRGCWDNNSQVCCDGPCPC